jgi:hypothetical protein
LELKAERMEQLVNISSIKQKWKGINKIRDGIDIETNMDKLIEIDKLMLESINKKIGLLNKLHD